MKIDQIILIHLLKNREVTLQGIGTFYLDPLIPIPPTIDTEITLPENAITFRHDAGAAEDASLINTIMLHTRKLKPLASADLDSFLLWQKQLMNINMPFKLGNLGLLQRTTQGILTFMANTSPVSKLKPGEKSIHNKPGNPSWPTINRDKLDFLKKILPLAIAILLGIGLSTWAIFRFITKRNPGRQFSEQTGPANSSNYKITSTQKDSQARPVREVFKSQNGNDAYVFKIVLLKTTSKKEALKTLNEIYGFGHSAFMYTIGSLYKVAIPFNRPISDTSLIKDSLNRYNSTANGFVEME